MNVHQVLRYIECRRRDTMRAYESMLVKGTFKDPVRVKRLLEDLFERMAIDFKETW